MPFVFLDEDGNVVALSTSDVSLVDAQALNPDITQRIANGPTGLVHVSAAGRFGNPDYYHRHTSGDGTLIGHYSQIAVIGIVPLTALQPVQITNLLQVDNKQFVIHAPAPPGTMFWSSVNGDATGPIDRGGGPSLVAPFSASETGAKNATISYVDPVYLQQIDLEWADPSDWGAGDRFQVRIVTPASSVVANPGSGNCTLAAAGGGNRILPAPLNDGTHDVTLSSAVPVLDAQGPWFVDERTGNVSPTPSGTPGRDRRCSLYDFQRPPLYMVRDVALTNSQGHMELHMDPVQWISDRWNIRIDVNKTVSPTNACEISCRLTMYRWKVTVSAP